jgi:hypothetical protein
VKQIPEKEKREAALRRISLPEHKIPDFLTFSKHSQKNILFSPEGALPPFFLKSPAATMEMASGGEALPNPSRRCRLLVQDPS